MAPTRWVGRDFDLRPLFPLPPPVDLDLSPPPLLLHLLQLLLLLLVLLPLLSGSRFVGSGELLGSTLERVIVTSSGCCSTFSSDVAVG